MIHIFYAALYALGLYLVSNGIDYGTYILFILTGAHLIGITLISILSTYLIRSDDKPDISKYDGNFAMNLLIQAFILVSSYELYLLGYELYSGMLMVTLTIAFFINLQNLRKETQND